MSCKKGWLHPGTPRLIPEMKKQRDAGNHESLCFYLQKGCKAALIIKRSLIQNIIRNFLFNNHRFHCPVNNLFRTVHLEFVKEKLKFVRKLFHDRGFHV